MRLLCLTWLLLCDMICPSYTGVTKMQRRQPNAQLHIDTIAHPFPGIFAFANALGNAFYFWGYFYFWRICGARQLNPV